MREAVIVSTARTPIGKAYRGAFNNTEAPTLGGHAVKHAVERAGLDPAEVEQRIANKELHVVRMKVPAEGECQFSDGLRGDIAIPWSQIDMQVLIKSDGLPTYHFANVVDDHLMHIVGMAKDKAGTEYYIIKNSWGETGPVNGYLYMSKAYARMKTVSVLMHKDALNN